MRTSQDFLFKRYEEWGASGLLPPKGCTLNWVNLVKLFLLIVVVIDFSLFTASFLAFPPLWYPLSPKSLKLDLDGNHLAALLRCGDWFVKNIVWNVFGLSLAPLFLFNALWRKRARHLQEKSTTILEPSASNIWPPPPQAR